MAAPFLRQNAAAPVYLSPYAFEPHLSGPERDIGLDPALRDCGRLRFTGGETDLGDGLTLAPCAGAAPAVPVDPAGLYTRQKGQLLPEDFRHEQYLVAEERGRRIGLNFHRTSTRFYKSGTGNPDKSYGWALSGPRQVVELPRQDPDDPFAPGEA